MEIKTKFNLGDKVYYLILGASSTKFIPEVRKCKVEGVRMTASLLPLKGESTSIEYNIFIEYPGHTNGGYNQVVTEDQIFKTRQEAINYVIKEVSSLNKEEDNE